MTEDRRERDEWRDQIYQLLVETAAKLDSHRETEDRVWRQFSSELSEHRTAISKLQQTVNNGIHEKVNGVHEDMKIVKRELPQFSKRGGFSEEKSYRVAMIAVGVSALSALTTVAMAVLSVFGG